jgi:hypothetical protein
MAPDQNKDDSRRTAGLKSSEGGRGDPNKASPAAVERYLKGIHYPTDKNGLLSTANGNNAPSDVMSVLNRFEDKTYNSTIDVSKEVGKVE